MDENTKTEIIKEFGMRAQRCFGCFIAYRFKDMYLGEDASYFCEHCKDESMFHFDQFSQVIDVAKLREAQKDEE